MSISDKVVLAAKTARQVKLIDDVRFVFNQQGSNYFVSVGNENLFLFENSSECAIWVNSLNSAVVPTLTALRSFYDSKVGAILA